MRRNKKTVILAKKCDCIFLRCLLPGISQQGLDIAWTLLGHCLDKEFTMCGQGLDKNLKRFRQLCHAYHQE
jgi:hypothetical protein